MPAVPAGAAPATPTLPAGSPNGSTVPSTAPGLPRLQFGRPDSEEEAFKPRQDVVVPPSQPGAAPHIDLEASKRRARQLAGGVDDGGGMLPVVPPPPDKKTKLAEDMEKAVKPDCRTYYANLGLLAVPPLVLTAGNNGPCHW